MKKQKPRRSRVPNASLKKGYNSKIRQEFIDQDYLHKLSEKELKFLDDFMSEWNNASVGKQSEAENNRFHKTAKEVKECTDRNNNRNNDVYGIAKARNLVSKQDYSALKDFIENKEPVNNNFVEDALIDFLDNAEDLKKSTDDTKK